MKILKIHSLDKGWRDRDEVLLHAAFQILVDFIEQERALKKHGQLEQKWYEEDQRNLHRLIEIRGHLWT